MSITEETLNAIHKRLQSLSVTAEPEQLAYLAKAFETIASNGKMLDIEDLSDEKLDELLKKYDEYTSKINTSKSASLEEIANYKTGLIEELVKVTNDNLTQINTVVDKKKAELTTAINKFSSVNDVPTCSTIRNEILIETEKRKFIKDGALPFLFGILSRSNDFYGVGNFTSELGAWPSDTTKTDSMLKLLAGCHSFTTEYAGFYKEPSLCFLQGSKGNFIEQEMYMKYANSANMYTYPYAAFGVFFVKNTTASSINSTVNFGGSSGWSSGYEGAGVFIGTPNNTNTNADKISEIAWKTAFSYTSSAPAFNGSATFVVPADSTVAVLLYTSSFYNTTPTSKNYHSQFIAWNLSKIRSEFLINGLEIDFDRTLNAWQCRGFSTTNQLWR